MFRTALVPVTFTEDDDLILAFAHGLGSLGVRRVVLAHVIDTAGTQPAVAPLAADEALEQLRRKGTSIVNAGLEVEARVSTGNPIRELAAMASESQVDVVVSGSHGKPLFADALSESVSARLLHDISVPHLIARYDLLRIPEDPARLLRRFGDTAILATDFSLSATRAFECVLSMSGAALKHLVLLHAVDPSLPEAQAHKMREGAEFELRNLQAMCAETGVSSSACIRIDTPVHAILDEIGLRRATGVIVGTRGRSAQQDTLLGTITTTLIRQASCPVLVVP